MQQWDGFLDLDPDTNLQQFGLLPTYNTSDYCKPTTIQAAANLQQPEI